MCSGSFHLEAAASPPRPQDLPVLHSCAGPHPLPACSLPRCFRLLPTSPPLTTQLSNHRSPRFCWLTQNSSEVETDEETVPPTLSDLSKSSIFSEWPQVILHPLHVGQSLWGHQSQIAGKRTLSRKPWDGWEGAVPALSPQLQRSLPVLSKLSQ